MQLGWVIVVAVVAACDKTPSKHFEDGPALGEGSDDPDAAARFDKTCARGELEACRSLGVMYQEGTGVSPDPRRATALFAKACDGGNARACNHYGLALADGMGTERDAAHAVTVYQKACDGNFTLACRNLGLLLRDGRGVAADLTRAETLLDKACRGGVPLACTSAGDLDAQLATKGQASQARWKQSFAHYRQGCESGEPTACRQIGIAYLDGKGVPRSTTTAAVWLERACLPDDPVACRILGAMLLAGAGLPRDAERGKQLLVRACEAKDSEACHVLALGSAAAVSIGDAGAGNASDAHVVLPNDAR